MRFIENVSQETISMLQRIYKHSKHHRVRFFRNDTINSSFPVLSIALFGQPFFPPGTSFKGTRTEGISANVAW